MAWHSGISGTRFRNGLESWPGTLGFLATDSGMGSKTGLALWDFSPQCRHKLKHDFKFQKVQISHCIYLPRFHIISAPSNVDLLPRPSSSQTSEQLWNGLALWQSAARNLLQPDAWPGTPGICSKKLTPT